MPLLLPTTVFHGEKCWSQLFRSALASKLWHVLVYGLLVAWIVDSRCEERGREIDGNRGDKGGERKREWQEVRKGEKGGGKWQGGGPPVSMAVVDRVAARRVRERGKGKIERQ